jgi:2-polyprenyl-3-methyl-5-hydroxy-6-metoxy-1,4-benzoquinol methylase
MSNTNRVDTTLFRESHYLGKPADVDDKIISRRIAILENYPQFFGNDKTLVEVGCGSGATINRIANRFSSALGMDVFDYAEPFAVLKEKYDASNSHFLQLDLETQRFDQQFDRLICFEVIEHFNSEATVSALARMLKPGGLAAISVPNKWWIFETHGAKLPLLPWNRVPFFSWLPRRIHERYANARIYTMSRISKLMKAHGFELMDQTYITAPMDVLKEGKLKRFVTKYIFRTDSTKNPFLSTSIFLMLRKKEI